MCDTVQNALDDAARLALAFAVVVHPPVATWSLNGLRCAYGSEWREGGYDEGCSIGNSASRIPHGEIS